MGTGGAVGAARGSKGRLLLNAPWSGFGAEGPDSVMARPAVRGTRRSWMPAGRHFDTMLRIYSMTGGTVARTSSVPHEMRDVSRRTVRKVSRGPVWAVSRRTQEPRGMPKFRFFLLSRPAILPRNPFFHSPTREAIRRNLSSTSQAREASESAFIRLRRLANLRMKSFRHFAEARTSR